MTTHAVQDELWFTTSIALCRWRLEGIPMPYEARVEAQAKEGGAVEVEIEFDNKRIIRNNARLAARIAVALAALRTEESDR